MIAEYEPHSLFAIVILNFDGSLYSIQRFIES